GGLHLQRHHARLRRHARPRRPDTGEGPLGHHRLRARPPARPARGEGGQEVSAGPVHPPSTPDGDLAATLQRWQRGAVIAGAAGLAVLVVGAIVQGTAEGGRSYLVGFQFVLGLGLGSLALLMLQYVTGGTWGWLLRRPLEAATRTVPVLALM